MADDRSEYEPSATTPPNRMRPASGVPADSDSSGAGPVAGEAVRLDAIDLAILHELAADGRVANNALARRAGVAPSTCLARVRNLVEAGVITGFHAQLDPALVGRPIQAMVSVRVQGEARTRLGDLMAYLATLPGVLNIYLLGGAHDFMLHVAAPSTDSLRYFVVDHLSANHDIALTETNLIFQHMQSHDIA